MKMLGREAGVPGPVKRFHLGRPGARTRVPAAPPPAEKPGIASVRVPPGPAPERPLADPKAPPLPAR